MPSYFKEFSNIFRYGLPAASRVPDYADWEMFENLNLNIFAKSKPLLEIIAEKSRDTVILKLRMCLGSLPAIYGKPGLHAVVLAGSVTCHIWKAWAPCSGTRWVSYLPYMESLGSMQWYLLASTSPITSFIRLAKYLHQ